MHTQIQQFLLVKIQPFLCPVLFYFLQESVMHLDKNKKPTNPSLGHNPTVKVDPTSTHSTMRINKNKEKKEKKEKNKESY